MSIRFPTSSSPSRYLALLMVLGALAGCRGVPTGTAQEQRLLIPAGDHEIPAVLVVPGGRAQAVPAVLLLHGLGSQKDEVGDMFRREAAALAERGIASLRIDFPCSGESTLPCTANTVDVQVAEARTAWEFLLSRPEVDGERAGVLGFSLGGIVAAAVAGADARVSALALWSTPADTAEAFRELRERYGDEATQAGQATVDLGFRTLELSAAFFESTLHSQPRRDLQGYTGPLLVIAGQQDTAIAEGAPLLVSSAGGDDATFELIPGADHIYGVLGPDDTLARQVLTRTADWFGHAL